MSEEEFLELISKIPKDENNRTLSTYGSINVEDLQNAVKRLKKIPNYDELLKENENLQQRIDKAINDLEIIIDIIKKQPTGDDKWMLDRLESNISILKGEDSND